MSIMAFYIFLPVSSQNIWVPFTSPTPQPASITLVESDNISVEFNAEIFGMYQLDTTVLSTDFQRISTPSGSVTIMVGHPEIPIIRQLIAIPHCDDVTLTVNVTETTSFSNYFVYPAPELVEVIHPDSSITVEESFVYDTTAYLQNQNYPQVTAEIVSTGYLRDQMYAEVFIYPIQFNPVTGNLQVNINYELTLTFTNPSGPVNENTGIFNNVASNVFLNYVSSGITAKINDRPGYTGNINWITISNQGQAADIIADYLIITDGVFWDPSGQTSDLLKIAQHRAEYNGFDIAIVEAKLIMSVYYDPLNEPYHNERAIRNFIFDVYDLGSANNTHDGKLGYVLLVGDALFDDNYSVPTSYDPDPGATSPGGFAYPSDYYYSCLTTIWSGHDHVGDVFIGRFCCDDNTELGNIIYKTIYYEREWQSRQAWKKNIGVFFGMNATNNSGYTHHFKYYLNNLVGGNGYSNSYFYYTDPEPYDDCIQYLRNGALIYHYIGHGFVDKWNDNSVQHLDVCQFVTNHHKNEFVISTACQTGHFDSGWEESFAEKTMYCSEQRGFVGVIASGRNLSVMYASQWYEPYSFKEYIYTSIFEHLSHIAGEFILEAKIAVTAPLTYTPCIAYNYFGDPALNLMAEGFEITNNVTLNCPITISSEIYVRPGAVLTIPSDCYIEFVNDGKLIIDNGTPNPGELIIYPGNDPSTTITGINSYNAIDVYGNIIFHQHTNKKITFTSPENHSWRGLAISNLSLDLDILTPLEFENCGFTTHLADLSISPVMLRNSFTNSNIWSTHGSLVLENSDFINTPVFVIDPVNDDASVEIRNCTINNESNINYSSIFIERYRNYNIHDNTINFSVGDGITIYNCGGISEGNFDNIIFNNSINYTASAQSLHKGIKIYRSIADIELNNITNTDYGIVGLNNSVISILGDQTATTNDDTQVIQDNISYQLYFSNNSYPEEISYNVIANGEVNKNPLVYNDANPPIGQLFNIEYNCWDNHFNAQTDLIPENKYDWEPIWCPGTYKSTSSNSSVYSGNQILYSSAMQHIENGEYLTAQSELKEIISDYPETETAKNSVKQLYELENVLNKDYQLLKNYYETEPNLQNSDLLGKLADWMISYCNVELGEFQLAIDWYDNVIDTTNSESDSTFAAIDMGEAALAMGTNMKGSIQCNNNQFIFNSRKEFEINREYLINELLKQNVLDEEINQNVGSDSLNKLAFLHQNTPNPFSSETNIKVEIFRDCNINLQIFDFSGEKLLSLADGGYLKGDYRFVVNTDYFSSGVYYYCLFVNGILGDTKKMIIIK